MDRSLAMGRKRNQGKARRAAKVAKAREEADEREENNNLTANLSEEADERDNQATTGQEQSLLSAQMRQVQAREECKHGLNHPFASTDDVILQFVSIFMESFDKAIERGDGSVLDCLFDARNATCYEFAGVWYDSAKLETAMSFSLFFGTQQYLGGYYGDARASATFARQAATVARYFQQYIAVMLKQTQALINWPKIFETYYGDDHTLVKFFRHRIPCSCLDEKYEEVKHITKMSYCSNPQCSIPGRKVERSNTKDCSRCHRVVYCSRKCQEADWTEHKPICDHSTAMIAKFEAKRQK